MVQRWIRSGVVRTALAGLLLAQMAAGSLCVMPKSLHAKAASACAAMPAAADAAEPHAAAHPAPDDAAPAACAHCDEPDWAAGPSAPAVQPALVATFAAAAMPFPSFSSPRLRVAIAWTPQSSGALLYAHTLRLRL